jgi:hypothetical protein
VLLVDYEAARDDDRSVVTTQAALFGAAVAVMAFSTAAASQTCQIDAKDRGCLEVPDPLLGALPLGPLAMIAFLQVIGAISTVRNYYIRGLEAELRRYAGGPLSAIRAGTPSEAIYPASYFELMTNMVSMRRGHLGFRLMNTVLLIAILVIFGGLAVFIALHVGVETRIAMGAVYGFLAALMLVQAATATVGGRRLFKRVARQHADGTNSKLPSVPESDIEQRSLVSYLLLPRVEECVKWLFLLASFGLGAWALGGIEKETAIHAGVVFIAFEYLLYEARYQWNDVRGYKSDSKHPERSVRRRLPMGSTPLKSRRNVIASLIVALLRVLAAIALGIAFGNEVLVPVLVLILLVFGVAGVYERLRLRLEAKNDGDDGTSRDVVAVWTWVGVGYAIRGGAGLWLAGFALDSPVLLLAVPMFVAYGSMFVTLTWVLEALSLCAHPEEESGDDGDDWKKNVTYTEALSDKHHLRLLLPYVDIEATEGPSGLEPNSRKKTALKSTGKVRAPWNAATVAAAPLSAAAGFALAGAGQFPSGSLPFVFAGMAVAIIGACAMAVMPSARWRPATVVATASILGTLGFIADLQTPLLACVPWLVVGATYFWFRDQSYDTLHAGARPLVECAAHAYTAILRLCAGPATADLIGLPKKKPKEKAVEPRRPSRAPEPHP